MNEMEGERLGPAHPPPPRMASLPPLKCSTDARGGRPADASQGEETDAWVPKRAPHGAVFNHATQTHKADRRHLWKLLSKFIFWTSLIWNVLCSFLSLSTFFWISSWIMHQFWSNMCTARIQGLLLSWPPAGMFVMEPPWQFQRGGYIPSQEARASECSGEGFLSSFKCSH